MNKKFIAILATLPVATLGAAGFALADDNGNTFVGNWNAAYVSNFVVTGASSDSNSADGGDGGEAGAGGDVVSSGDANTGGNGGMGGNGGNGGSVTTGEAGAFAYVDNMVNTNDTEINHCACAEEEGEDDGDINGDDVVMNFNGWLGEEEELGVFVGNEVLTGADSGNSSTDGGSGYYGEEDNNDGGDVVESGDENVGGNGGDNGNGGAGGSVTTGASGALSNLMNVINTNITRILR